jgi:hypothetical protein
MAIREGVFGKNGGAIIRWVQGNVEQDGIILQVEWPVAQTLRPIDAPYLDLPAYSDVPVLAGLQDFPFLLDDTAINRQRRQRPVGIYGKSSFLEATDGLAELLTFINTHSANNTWVSP